MTDDGENPPVSEISPGGDGAIGDGSNETDGGRAKADRAWRVAQLASTLMASRVKKLREAGRLRDLSDEYLDAEFSGALLRAEWLLSQAEEHEHEVGAYQVFTEGEFLTAEKIAKQFEGAGWKGLSSKVPVTRLMDELWEWMSELRDAAYEHSPMKTNEIVARAYKRVTEFLKALREDPDVQGAYPDLDDSAQKILEAVVEAPGKGGTTHGERIEHQVSIAAFTDWCFCFETKDGREVRRYRPHEIFLFAAMNGWNGESSDKLVRHRTELNAKFVPRRKRSLFGGGSLTAFGKFSASNPLLADLEEPSGVEAGDGSARGEDEEVGPS